MFLLCLTVIFGMAFYLGTLIGLWFSDRLVKAQVRGFTERLAEVKELFQSENNWIVDRMREQNDSIKELKSEISKIKGD